MQHRGGSLIYLWEFSTLLCDSVPQTHSPNASGLGYYDNWYSTSHIYSVNENEILYNWLDKLLLKSFWGKTKLREKDRWIDSMYLYAKMHNIN